MIRRIILENFMSHARTVLEPARGLTVLVGPNNCGKSAVVTALQAVCSNDSGSFMVRHGEKDCRVTIETDDGHEITWRRIKDTVSYVIDGREIHRLKGGVPDDLDTLLKLPRVRSEDGNDEFDIHFGAQKEPIFLLNEPERKQAMFFASSSDAEYLMRMQKRHQEKVRDARRDRDRLSGQVAKLALKLAVLEPAGELDAALHSAAESHAALLDQDERITEQAFQTESLARGQVSLARLVRDRDCLAPLSPPPELTPPGPLSQLVEQLAATTTRRAAESDRARVLAPLSAPPEQTPVEPLVRLGRELRDAARINEFEQRRATATLPLKLPPTLSDTAPLERLTAALVDSARVSSRIEARSRTLAPLQNVPLIMDEAPRAALLRDWQSAASEATRMTARHAVLNRLPPVPELISTARLEAQIAEAQRAEEHHARMDAECVLLSALALPTPPRDTAPLTTCVEQQAAAETEVTRLTRECHDVLVEQAAVRDALCEWTRANPVCPTCGGFVDPERLLAGEHAHA